MYLSPDLLAYAYQDIITCIEFLDEIIDVCSGIGKIPEEFGFSDSAITNLENEASAIKATLNSVIITRIDNVVNNFFSAEERGEFYTNIYNLSTSIPYTIEPYYGSDIKDIYEEGDEKLQKEIKDYLKIKYPEVDIEDEQFIRILLNNTDFKYEGVQKYDANGVTIKAYKLYDEKSKRTYYIQKNLKSEFDVNEIIDTYDSMPSDLSTSNKTVVMTNEVNPNDKNSQDEYNNPNFTSAACANDNRIIFWDASFDNSPYTVTKTLYHEAAHNYDNKKGDFTISNSKEWADAVKEDGNFSSDYAKDSYKMYKEQGAQMDLYCEDYAEAVKNLYDMGEEKYSRKYPARAEILSEQFPELFPNKNFVGPRQRVESPVPGHDYNAEVEEKGGLG